MKEQSVISRNASESSATHLATGRMNASVEMEQRGDKISAFCYFLRHMKPHFFLGGLLLSGLTLLAGGSAPAQTPTKFFQDSDMMNIGVYYYPEAWPTNQWPRDIANIKKMLEFVHMGEFAWAFMEPKEGKYDFDWLDRNIQLCAQHGLKVILCTPSPTPPVWLVGKTSGGADGGRRAGRWCTARGSRPTGFAGLSRLGRQNCRRTRQTLRQRPGRVGLAA